MERVEKRRVWVRTRGTIFQWPANRIKLMRWVPHLMTWSDDGEGGGPVTGVCDARLVISLLGLYLYCCVTISFQTNFFYFLFFLEINYNGIFVIDGKKHIFHLYVFFILINEERKRQNNRIQLHQRKRRLFGTYRGIHGKRRLRRCNQRR